MNAYISVMQSIENKLDNIKNFIEETLETIIVRQPRPKKIPLDNTILNNAIVRRKYVRTIWFTLL